MIAKEEAKNTEKNRFNAKKFEEYFKLIKEFEIDSTERFNEIKEYYSKGLLTFNIP